MNILDYLATEFAPFEEKPFNPVDSAIFSQFCSVNAEGIVTGPHGMDARPPLERPPLERPSLGTLIKTLFAPAENSAHFIDFVRAEHYANMFSGLMPEKMKENMLALAASPRFRPVTICNYLNVFDSGQQMQFAAMTFVYKQEFAYIGFRGTDASITGWREDFNMAYSTSVPAQQQALQYLETVAAGLPRKLIVGGHSKGGNLALYAALRARPDVQDRIDIVYSHDGPGFKANTFSEADWNRLRGRIHRSVPQDSLVGMLMESHAVPHVVKSTERGIMQHSPFSWEVQDGDFLYLDDLTNTAKFADVVLDEWLSRYTDEEAAAIVDALFQVIEATGVQSANDIVFGGAKMISFITDTATKISDDTRTVLLAALGSLVEISARKAKQNIVEKIVPKS